MTKPPVNVKSSAVNQQRDATSSEDTEAVDLFHVVRIQRCVHAQVQTVPLKMTQCCRLA